MYHTYSIVGIAATDRVPDAGQPMRHQHVEAEQQYEHGGAIFQIAIQLAHHTSQSQ